MSPDAQVRRRIVVTGLGVVSPLGTDVETFWAGITSGRVATAPITRFSGEGHPTHLAAEVRDPALTSCEDPDAAVPRSVRYAEHAVGAALEHAGLRGHPTLRRAGLVLGTVMGTRPHLEELRRQGRPLTGDLSWDTPGALAREPARRFGLLGPRHVVAAGCAAGNTAVAAAADCIRSGQAEVMVTGGVDELSEAVLRLFATLRALTPDQVRPFDRDRRGMLPSEGAGVLVLESLEHALGRGATVLAELCGYAIAADAHHMTAPHPQGHGVLRCMRDSLDQAGMKVTDVDYVSAHGTGTPGNDALEAACLARYFGTGGPAVSSIKGMLGHSQGGASALEAIACVLAITRGRVPGNPTLRIADDACAGLDLVRGAAREMPVRVALSNAFGFGGNTSTVVLGGYTS
ncbi:MAG: beta-ketoacyl-[acyl-carrier-protein] synthase family protein [Actinoallomurus sp.]